MRPLDLMLISLSTVATYALLAAGLEKRTRTATVRRLAKEEPAAAQARVRPLLVQAASRLRGRLAQRALERLRLRQSADELLETAGLKWDAAGLLHRTVAAFLAGFALVTLPTANRYQLASLAGGAVASLAFLLWVRRRARRRQEQFEGQFPDCLEFLSRSMRAGHAFAAALEMVSKEFADPLAAEFRRVYEEQNLGQPLEIVLKKLGRRLPRMDVKFFVSAVLLQRRTGGNLAELLDKLAEIIRERFKLRGRIRAVSAQGLMSGRILAAIPLAVGVIMFVVNPQYTRFFFDDPVGNQLLARAVTLQLAGYAAIRRIVTIEV